MLEAAGKLLAKRIAFKLLEIAGIIAPD